MPIPHRRCAVIGALLLPVVLAACSSGGSTPNHTLPAITPAADASPSASPAGEPKTYEAVKAAVDRVDAAGAKGDGGTEWDMLTAAGQATMTRADYIKVVAGCPKLVRLTTLSVALNAGGTSATVTVDGGPSQGGQYTWQLVYENGHWRHQPSDAAMRWMSLGADKALATLRNNGVC